MMPPDPITRPIAPHAREKNAIRTATESDRMTLASGRDAGDTTAADSDDTIIIHAVRYDPCFSA